MKGVAIVLIVGVFLAHDGANWLGELSGFTPAATFYMLHGVWGATLSALLLMVLWAAHESFWRDLAMAAVTISIVEGLLIPVCRLATDDIRAVPRGTSLCDYATGLPLHAVLLSIEVLLISVITGRWINKWQKT